MKAHGVDFFAMPFLVAQLLDPAGVPYAPCFIIRCSQEYRCKLVESNGIDAIGVAFYFNGFLLFQSGVESPDHYLSESSPSDNVGSKGRNFADARMDVHIAQLIHRLKPRHFLPKLGSVFIEYIPYLALATRTHCDKVLTPLTESAVGDSTIITIIREYVVELETTVHQLIKFTINFGLIQLFDCFSFYLYALVAFAKGRHCYFLSRHQQRVCLHVPVVVFSICNTSSNGIDNIFCMKITILLLALILTVTANKRRADPQIPSVESCLRRVPILQEFSNNLISNVSSPIFWLQVVGVILLIGLHIFGVFVCLKKRNQRNMIRNYMKVREMMFSETLVQNGIERKKAYSRPKTLHV